MSLSATATAQADWYPPRVELTVTAGSPIVDNTAVSCVRVHSDGTRHPVIVQSDLRLSAFEAIFYDYHPPRGMDLSYEVTVGATTATADAMVWAATDPNLMPVDTGTGGEARMLEWVRSSGALTVTANAATVAGGESITARGIPVTEGVVYSFGVDVSGAATVSLQFRSGGVLLGLPETVSAATADRPFLDTEAPADAVLVDITVTNDSGGNITVSQPTLLEGTDYPAAAAPTQVPADSPVRITVDADEVWLLHRSNPALSVRLDALSALSDVQRAPWVGSFRIPGRRNTVHVTDGVLHGGSGQLDARCDSDASLELLADLLGDGGPILVSTPGLAGWDVKWQWVQPTGSTFANPAGIGSYPYRHVVISYEETDQPAVAGVGARTYAALKAEFVGLTYADLKTMFDKYRDLKTDTRVA